MSNAYIGSTSNTIDLPLNYIHEPAKMESRTSMLVNYAVTTGDVAVTKYHFEIPGITVSERLAMRAWSLKQLTMDFVDNLQIPEVFSTTGNSTGTVTINLHRSLASTSTGDISITFNDVTQDVTISTATNPSSGDVYVATDGTMTFGPCSSSDENIIVNYIPKYAVHVIGDGQEFVAKNTDGNAISRYRVVLEEV